MELLLDDLDMASKTCVAVMCMGLDDKALVCFSTFLFVVFVGCWMVLTNCLLKAEVFCSGVTAGLSWKVTMVLDCEGGVLPSVVVYCVPYGVGVLLWSPIWSSLAFYCSALCLPISFVISLLKVVMRVLWHVVCFFLL